MRIFIIVTKNKIIEENIFNILIKCFKKFQEVITIHNIDITNDIDSNIIIKTPKTMNDIEFKHFLVLLSLISFI